MKLTLIRCSWVLFSFSCPNYHNPNHTLNTRETGKGKSDIKQEKATSQIGKTITNGDNMPDLNQPAHFLDLDCIKNKGASPNYNLTRTICDSCKFEIKKNIYMNNTLFNMPVKYPNANDEKDKS